MAVTIVVAQIKVARGVAGAALFVNSRGVILKVSGTIGNNDTGTYDATSHKVLLDAGGIPVIIGLPFGIQPSISLGIITFTAGAAAAFTALNSYCILITEK